MNIDTWAVVLATVVGPILAVQAQQFVSRLTDRRDRQRTLFRTLMNTRAATLSQEAVVAFNSIPIEFHRDKKIMPKWHNVLDHVNTRPVTDAWLQKRFDLYIDLLEAIARKLKYDFDTSALKKVYSPEGHAKLESDQEVIRRGLVELLEGQRTLPMEVRSVAQDEEIAVRTKGLQEQLGSWLRGETVPRIRIDAEKP